MVRKSERLDMQRVENYIKAFGPLPTRLIASHFGCSGFSDLNRKMRNLPTLKSIYKSGYLGRGNRTLVWYHVDGIKPEGAIE